MMGDEYEWMRFAKRHTGSWASEAVRAILNAHTTIADDATLGDRTKAIDAAYPFGAREYFPYKQWLKVRRDYLERYGYVSRGKPKVGRAHNELPGVVYESPMERMKRRSAVSA